MVWSWNITDSTVNTLKYWFSKYGLPKQIVTDHGSQFTSEDFKCFCKMNDIKYILSAPYHQSSNGQAKRFVEKITKDQWCRKGWCSYKVV